MKRKKQNQVHEFISNLKVLLKGWGVDRASINNAKKMGVRYNKEVEGHHVPKWYPDNFFQIDRGICDLETNNKGFDLPHHFYELLNIIQNRTKSCILDVDSTGK